MISNIVFRIYQWLKRMEIKQQQHQLRSQANVKIAERVYFGPHTAVYVETKQCSVVIDEDFYTRSFCNIRVGDTGVLTIQKNVFWNNYCSVNCMYSIEIGENVMFGEGVKIYDHNHVITKSESVNIIRNELDYGKVMIGKNSWLGSNVTVLKGVTIGENVVVGANCLIYKDIPANSIVKSAAGLDVTTIE